MIEKIPASEYNICENDVLVDLRDYDLFSFGTIEGAINIPADKIDELYSLPEDKRIVLFCQTGDFSSKIAQLLSENGYNVADLTGGYREWLVSCMK